MALERVNKREFHGRGRLHFMNGLRILRGHGHSSPTGSRQIAPTILAFSGRLFCEGFLPAAAGLHVALFWGLIFFHQRVKNSDCTMQQLEIGQCLVRIMSHESRIINHES